jgi:Arc/MetJ-type ribon-helix-helix transcriptional regulator
VTELQLTLDQEAFIRQAIESGRLQRKEDAVQQAMSFWEERERRRLKIFALSIRRRRRSTGAKGASLRQVGPKESPLMNGFRLSPEAEAEPDAIWIHVAIESGSTDRDCSGCGVRTLARRVHTRVNAWSELYKFAEWQYRLSRRPMYGYRASSQKRSVINPEGFLGPAL